MEFTPQSFVWVNNTGGLFSGVKGDSSLVFSTVSDGDMTIEGLDFPTLSIETTITTINLEGEPVEGQDEYFSEKISADGTTLTLSVDTIDYNTAYEYYSESFIRYNNTATSVITVTNSAGDTKTYTVKQTQYPPVYFVHASGSTGQSTMVKGNDVTEVDACAYVYQVYNWEYNKDTSWGFDYDVTYYIDNKDGAEDTTGVDTFHKNMYTCLVDDDYISGAIYNYTSKVDAGVASATADAYAAKISGTNGLGESIVFESINGFYLRFNGPYTTVGENYGSAPYKAFAIVRDFSNLTSGKYGVYAADITVIVKDQFGEEYSIVNSMGGTYNRHYY
ncbi:MAG: hypothetical protein R3Y68_03210 [Rikenellaceae bacterium]